MINSFSVFKEVTNYRESFPELSAEEAIAIAYFNETKDLDLNPWLKKDFTIWLDSSLEKLPKYKQDKFLFFSLKSPDVYDLIINKKLLDNLVFTFEESPVFSEDYELSNLVFVCTKSKNGVKLRDGSVVFRSNTKFKIVKTITSILNFSCEHNKRFESYKAEDLYRKMATELKFPEEEAEILSLNDYENLYGLFCEKSVVYLHLEEV